jgi:glycosyltransferase involved in cell wall biosynthesis
MRIAYLSPSGQLGGAEACLLDMVAVVRNSRPDWDVNVILGEPGPLQQKLTALDVKTTVLPLPATIARLGDSGAGSRLRLAWNLIRSSPQILSYRSQFQHQFAQLRPDVIHTNGFKMHVFGALASRRSKVVWHIHDYVGCRPLMVRILRQLSPRVEAVIANSQSVADDVRRMLPVRKVVPIFNVVDLDEFCPEGTRLPLPDAPPGAVRVGLVATMAWWKGHRLFLNAIAKVEKNIPIYAVIVGGSVYQTASRQESIEGLRAYAEKLGISDRVCFTGFVDEPAAAMRSLDIVVHASTEPEPFGRVIVEAMACGKPVITSGTGGASEILALGDFARTFSSGNAESLAAVISELACNSQLRIQLGQSGLRIASDHFGRNKLAAELIPFYERLTATPLAEPSPMQDAVLR